MIAELFKQYLKTKTGLSERSAMHYINGINTINSLLAKNDFPVRDLYTVESSQSLELVESFLKSNPEFIAKDSVGHKMYSTAFRHFCNFVYKDSEFFSDNMLLMDVAVKKPPLDSATSKRWKRNPIVIAHAIESAHYMCELDRSHETFISQSTGKAYMEGHHIIAMKHQALFACSLDVYANVDCLCPICHRMMHFGRLTDKKRIAEVLYESRCERLQKSGINLTKDEFINLVIENENC